MPDEAPASSRKSWWANRSEKFKQTVIVALIGAIPGTLAGTAGLLKKQDEKTAREVYSVLVKYIEHLSSENSSSAASIEATNKRLQVLTERVDALSKKLDEASAMSTMPAASAPPLVPPTRGARIRVTSRTAHAPPAPPPPAAFDKDGVVELPANWPAE